MSHILLIDDDKAIGEVMDVVLEELGHTVTVIPSFDDLKSSKSISADLILLDGNIGVSSGKEIGAYLRTRSSLQSTPLILFSADDSVEKIAKDMKAQGILKKPFEIDQLSEIIEQYS
ncbi:MAG TPA: response regulator [Candidatus Levybacteria bacterium]|nr:response regulator [Candidatus Levybacteria bacterium]